MTPSWWVLWVRRSFQPKYLTSKFANLKKSLEVRGWNADYDQTIQLYYEWNNLAWRGADLTLGIEFVRLKVEKVSISTHCTVIVIAVTWRWGTVSSLTPLPCTLGWKEMGRFLTVREESLQRSKWNRLDDPWIIRDGSESEMMTIWARFSLKSIPMETRACLQICVYTWVSIHSTTSLLFQLRWCLISNEHTYCWDLGF